MELIQATVKHPSLSEAAAEALRDSYSGSIHFSVIYQLEDPRKPIALSLLIAHHWQVNNHIFQG